MELKFNLKTLPIFLVLYGIFFAVTILQMARDGFKVNIVETYYFVFPIMAIFIWLAAFIFSRFYSTRVLGKVVTACNELGMRKKMNLEDIEEVVEQNFLGLNYARAYPKGLMNPIWIPLFHVDQAGVEKLLIAKCGEGHPITKYFERKRRA